MLKPLEPAHLNVTVLPAASPALDLAQCGLCGRETYITLILSDDHPRCCRHCFRSRAARVRARR